MMHMDMVGTVEDRVEVQVLVESTLGMQAIIMSLRMSF